MVKLGMIKNVLEKKRSVAKKVVEGGRGGGGREEEERVSTYDQGVGRGGW